MDEGAADVDALVVAVPPLLESTTLADLVPDLLEIAERYGVRLAIVGGRGESADGTGRADGESRIFGADYAIAFLDELESSSSLRCRHSRARVPETVGWVSPSRRGRMGDAACLQQRVQGRQQVEVEVRHGVRNRPAACRR